MESFLIRSSHFDTTLQMFVQKFTTGVSLNNSKFTVECGNKYRHMYYCIVLAMSCSDVREYMMMIVDCVNYYSLCGTVYSSGIWNAILGSTEKSRTAFSGPEFLLVGSLTQWAWWHLTRSNYILRYQIKSIGK